MSPKLYTLDASPPCRAVYITAKALGITLDIENVDLLALEHLEPKYLEINPQHTIPTLDDEGYIVWDSHAINAYLVGRYGKDDSLYPKDVKRRALVDQRLHFDTGNAFNEILKIVKPMRLYGVKTIEDEKIEDVHETYGFLESFLRGNEWTAGENVTIADFSFISTITSLDVIVPISSEKYPNITQWIERCKALPYYDVNVKGLEDFRSFVTKLMS